MFNLFEKSKNTPCSKLLIYLIEQINETYRLDIIYKVQNVKILLPKDHDLELLSLIKLKLVIMYFINNILKKNKHIINYDIYIEIYVNLTDLLNSINTKFFCVFV